MADSDDLRCCPPLFGPEIDEGDAADLAVVFKALADPVRIRLVNIVARSGEVCACDLPAAVDRSQPTVSHHLSQLVKAGILRREKRGKWAWFQLDDDRVASVAEVLTQPATTP